MAPSVELAPAPVNLANSKSDMAPSRLEVLPVVVANTKSDNPYVQRSYKAKTPEEMILAYKDWAATYDSHMVEIGYVAPGLVAETAAQQGKITGESMILDAGCGSGIVGVELARRGAQTIDGIDLSEEMLNVAEKTGVYRILEAANLMNEVIYDDDTYDTIVCVGTLTTGHVGPRPALAEFARITKPGGTIVATILPQLWKASGFDAEVERLEKSGKVQVISNDINPYRRGQDAHFLILRVV